jgi:hypothetical protein
MARRTRKAHSGRRHTRKASPQMTVEGLHASFEKLDKRARVLIQQGATDSELGHGIQRAWSEQFHASLAPAAVRGLVTHYRSILKNVRNTRRARKSQRGGMAPMDYVMGPGSAATMYGRFPVEMGSSASALTTMDQFKESQVSRACDSTGGYPAPGFMKGGGIVDSLANVFMPASVPRNFMESAVSAVQGSPITNPPADPVRGYAGTVTFEPRPFDTQSIAKISSLAPIYQPM